jgi:excisionase family DNA binding protein
MIHQNEHPPAAALLTVAQVARQLGLSGATVRRWCDAGLIGCIRVGVRQDRRIPRAEIERLQRVAAANREAITSASVTTVTV